MKPVESRLRLALLAVGAIALAGSVVELTLAEHFESATQLVPYVLAGLGLGAIGWLLVSPGRRSILCVRIAAVALVAGSALGVYEHLEGNVALELEVRPGASTSDVLVEAVLGGAPLFAPGVLALAGLAVAAATLQHPALVKDNEGLA